MERNKKARVIAFYLPQFHPIPENDEWWGKGFTEWTNVAKAKPLFKGHYQPRVPADLGFYDLRMPEIRESQADMAKQAGIEGFCYWHYWFGNGKQLLDMPFNEVLESGKPDFPFCLGWANHSWSNKTWKVGPRQGKECLLVEQQYPGEEDHILHFNSLLKAFKDKRYILVDGKPLFVIYDPLGFPSVNEFIKLWNRLAIDNGMNGFHFVGITNNLAGVKSDNAGNKGSFLPNIQESSSLIYNKILEAGFDAVNSRGFLRAELVVKGTYRKYLLRLINLAFNGIFLQIYQYKDIIKHLFVSEDTWENVYPTIVPNWDRSPRGGKLHDVYHESTPEFFSKHIDSALDIVKGKKDEHKIIFLMSWNEWGEGNYVEPDIVFGHRYLDVLREKLTYL